MRRGRPRAREGGLAYLGVLLMIAAIGIGVMEASTLWANARQRERETELLFVGDQFRNAIEHYYNSGDGSRYPESLEALVEDKRVPYTLRHLRRIYVDPMTGDADWELVKSPDGAIMGVYSKPAGKPLKQGGFEPQDAGFENKNSYEDWKFVYQPAQKEPGGNPGPGPSPDPAPGPNPNPNPNNGNAAP